MQPFFKKACGDVLCSLVGKHASTSSSSLKQASRRSLCPPFRGIYPLHDSFPPPLLSPSRVFISLSFSKVLFDLYPLFATTPTLNHYTSTFFDNALLDFILVQAHRGTQSQRHRSGIQASLDQLLEALRSPDSTRRADLQLCLRPLHQQYLHLLVDSGEVVRKFRLFDALCRWIILALHGRGT